MKKHFYIYALVNVLQSLHTTRAREQAVQVYMDAVNDLDVAVEEFPTWSSHEGHT